MPLETKRLNEVNLPIVAAAPELASALGGTFHLAPLRRGRRIEKLLGAGGLSPNYPRFDRTLYLGKGRLEFTSIKSRDLRTGRYKSLKEFQRVTRRDIDAVADIEHIPRWRHSDRKISLIPFERSLGERFVLEVVVCGADRHKGFMKAVTELAGHARVRNVVLRVFSV